MSDGKPALLRIARGAQHDAFVAVFRIGEGAEIGIQIPRGTAEEDMLAVARDHFWRLMRATTEATAAWEMPDDVRQRVDPERRQPTGFSNRGGRS